MFNFSSARVLTNVKPPKSNVPELALTPTKGNMRLNPAGLSLLNAGVEGRVTIIEGEDAESGKPVYGICKVAADSGVGAKLGSATGKKGGSLQFSSANVWQSLGGDTDSRTFFTISEEGVEVDDLGTVYPIELSRVEDKMVRGENDEDGAGEE